MRMTAIGRSGRSSGHNSRRCANVGAPRARIGLVDDGVPGLRTIGDTSMSYSVPTSTRLGCIGDECGLWCSPGPGRIVAVEGIFDAERGVIRATELTLTD